MKIDAIKNKNVIAGAIFLLCGTLFVGSTILSGCSHFGTRPSAEESKAFERSPQYRKQLGQFVNRQENAYEQMRARNGYSGLLKFLFSSKGDRVPSKPLSVVKPNIDSFLKKEDDLKVIWFGHSSLMLNFEGKIVLIDPMLFDHASPVSFLANRFQPPPLRVTELPKIDYIIISHDHYDHLDMPTVQYFKDKDTSFIVPLGIGSYLAGWGIDKKRIKELDWWESTSNSEIEFVATPSQHYSGREFSNRNQTLWAGWVVKSKKHKVFFSGDSGYDTHFKEIGKRYGPLDVAFIENGQYNKDWEEIHILPEQFYQTFSDLNVKRYFPIHWGGFDLARHSWHEPIEKIYQISKEKNIPLIVPKIGEIVVVNDDYRTTPWWKEVVAFEDVNK